MMASAKTFTAPKVAVVAPKRAQVVVNAQADRRVVLSGLIAGVAALVADKAQAGVTNVDLFDDRKAKEAGFDIIYEARDLSLPQSTRDGIDQFRGDVAATKTRFAESSRRVNTELGAMVDKSYWTPAREELRRQLGNMRQDLNTLASMKETKDARKAAKAETRVFIESAEKLDFAIRKKDLDAAQKAYAELKSSLATLTTTLV